VAVKETDGVDVTDPNVVDFVSSLVSETLSGERVC
jgi:hypothetical protein